MKADRVTVRHEAAHALVARLLDIPVESVDTRRTVFQHKGKQRLSVGFTSNGDECTARLNGLLFTPGDLDAESVAFLRKHLRVVLAGTLSEATFQVQTKGVADESDREGAQSICMRLSCGRLTVDPVTMRGSWSDVDPKKATAEWETAIKEVNGLLTVHSAEWDAITIRLQRDRRLSGEQIDTILAQLGCRRRYRVSSEPYPIPDSEESARPSA